MWHFLRRCNQRSMMSAAHGIQAILTSATQEYEQLLSLPELSGLWQRKGLLYVYHSHRALEAYSKTNQLLAEHFHEPAKRLTAEETLQVEPALKPSIAGAWYYEHDTHIRPDRLISKLRQYLVATGVRFVEDNSVQALDGTGKVARTVVTDCGVLEADAFVFAAGTWTPTLKELLGCRVPIEAGKGYSITMPRPVQCPSIPLIFPQHRVVATPFEDGYRLGSIMEFSGLDDSLPEERLELLRSGASHYLLEPTSQPELERWHGWRPMTYDSLPAIDRCPRWNNVWVAAGHNMLGLTMAPATGKLISEMVMGKMPHIDPTPYKLNRFC